MAHAASHDSRWEHGRGRHADRPRDIPAPGWKDILFRVFSQIKEDKLSMIAAGVAFYALLALFPALIAMVAIYGLVFNPADVETHVASLTGMLPQEAADILLTQLHDLVTKSGESLGIGAVLGVLIALWSASAGIRTLMEALNVAYDEEEKRGFFAFYGTAILLTLAAIIGAILAIATVIILPMVVKFLGLGSFVEGLISFARWPILAIAFIVGLAIMYRYGPSREEPKWRWVSWGAVIATVLWIIGSALFSLYVSSFADYNETYGSVGAVVILLTWFLLTSYAVLIGAEINAEMERQTHKDTTDGPDKPMGQRRAYAADTVGPSKA
jgi:membrane protein